MEDNIIFLNLNKLDNFPGLVSLKDNLIKKKIVFNHPLSQLSAEN